MFIRYCLACSLFIFSSFIQANSSLVNTVIKANYAEHYCAIGSKMSAIDQAIESQQAMSNELAWLSIGKAAYLEYCLGESSEQKALLTSVTQSSVENISSEAKSTAYTHLGDFLIEHEGRQEDACHLFYLAKGDNFQGLTYYTRHRIELMLLLYCDNQDPIDMYKKLLDKKAETEKIGDDFLSRKVLDTLYYFFIQNDEMYLATNASKELLQKYKHTFSNSELALAYYLLSIDSLLIGNFDDSKKYGDEFATLVSRHKLSNYEYLINVVYLQYYFSTQAYEKAYRYAQRLAPMLSTIQQFNETGKINIIYASVCFELNNRECVDGFINNLSTLTTKQDQDSLLLRALLLKVEAEKQGNMALLASIKTLESNWQKKLYDKQDSLLLVQINELAQASMKTQQRAQSIKASKLDVEQDVLLILLTLCGVITFSILWFLHRRQQKNALDPVTKVLSRKAGFLQFQSQGKPIEGKTHAFILFSLDNYESIKDQYGYQQADAVLKQLVIIAKKAVRRGDLIARVGNETFGIMLINSTKAIAYKVESKLTDKVNSASFFIDKNTSLKSSLLTGTSFNSDGDNGFITSFKQADETMQALAINKPALASH